MSARLSLATAALAAAAALPVAAAPRVVVDIAPVHAIVSRIMEGVGAPTLMVPPGASPHGYAMRPSQARALQEADVVFWIGPALTPWLSDPVETLAANAETVALLDAPGLTLWHVRPGGIFDGHVADQHGAGHANDHANDHQMHTHGAEPEHAHGGVDPHVWLDPANAAGMGRAAAEQLAATDPENAATYLENAEAFAAEMADLGQEIARDLAAVHDRPFVVFHDAYQYFEHRFGMPAAGSVALGDADRPSAARVAEIRDRIGEAGVVCIFTEPQFEPALVTTVTEGTTARMATLDPLGATLDPGPDLYPQLMQAFAAHIEQCLAPRS